MEPYYQGPRQAPRPTDAHELLPAPNVDPTNPFVPPDPTRVPAWEVPPLPVVSTPLVSVPEPKKG